MTNQNEFSVCQFFPDGSYEYIKRFIPALEAVETFKDYSNRPAAKIGIIRRLIVTDGGDCINMEWKFKEGYTYPPELVKLNDK